MTRRILTTLTGILILASTAIPVALADLPGGYPPRHATSYDGRSPDTKDALGHARDTLAVGQATATEARDVAVEFFRSQNERRYDDLCALFSRSFIRAHALRDRRTCAAVARVEFVWSLKIEFRLGKVVYQGDRLVVQAVADGAPGRIVLVREDGSLKILAVEGS